jgi:hypothetical protein
MQMDADAFEGSLSDLQTLLGIGPPVTQPAPDYTTLTYEQPDSLIQKIRRLARRAIAWRPGRRGRGSQQ